MQWPEKLPVMTTNKERTLLSKKRALVGSILLSIGFLSQSARGLAACEPNLYGQFLDQVQRLGPQTESLGQQLLSCPRDDYRQSAVFWLSFYYSMEQKSVQIRGLGRALPPSGSGDERIQVLYRAWQGDYAGLANRVRIGQRGFADDAYAMQVLARNLMRFERYKEGLAAYQQLISMQEGNDNSEVERLYALIWSRDQEAALLRIAALKRYDLSPYLKQSVDRAEGLLAKQGHPLQKNDGEYGIAWLKLAGKDWVDRRGYRRKTVEAEYHGVLELTAGAHEFGHPLETERQKEVSVQLGSSWRLTSNWRLLTELGYFTGGNRNITGRLDSFIQAGNDLQIGLGVRQEAVALVEKPLVVGDLGLMRDTAKAGVSLWKRWIFTAALARDGKEAPFEIYQSEVRLGPLVTEETKQDLGFFIPVDFTQRLKPAADTVSYPRQLVVGLGMRAAYGNDQYWHLSGELRLNSVHRTYYNSPDTYQNLLGAELRIEAKYFVQRSWFAFIEAERSFIERNPGEDADENESLVVIGLALTGAGHDTSSHVQGKE